MLIVLFDLDGVIVDNARFEEAVTARIVSALAEKFDVGFFEALNIWRQSLLRHAEHPQWHSYAFHCKQLGLDDVWKKAHLEERNRLRLCEGVEEALAQARNADDMWIVSDATRWVVDLKLDTLSIQHCFSMLFTSDQNGHKGGAAYWEIVASALAGKSASSIYIDNRMDRLVSAQRVLKRGEYVHVHGFDHATKTQSNTVECANLFEFASCNHGELAQALKKIMND